MFLVFIFLKILHFSIHKFLTELAQNPLVKRVISIFDKNKDGKISFAEFLSGLGALYGGFYLNVFFKIFFWGIKICRK